MRINILSAIGLLIALIPSIFAQNGTLNTPLNFNCSSLSSPHLVSNASINASSTEGQLTVRVSRAVICPQDARDKDPRCAVTASGSVNVSSITNATNIGNTSVLYSMVYRAFQSIGANSTELGNLTTNLERKDFSGTGKTLYVQPGQAAYMGFYPEYRCIEGIVETNEQCESIDEGLRRVSSQYSGKGIHICVPVKEARRKGSGKPSKRKTTVYAAGHIQLVNISVDEAKKEGMEFNPANPPHPRSTPVTSDPPAGTRLNDGQGRSVLIRPGFVSGLTMVLVTLCMVVFM